MADQAVRASPVGRACFHTDHPFGPVIHRVIAKIATGRNPADNLWRSGNMLGAIGLATSLVTRVVHGIDLAANETRLCISRSTGGIDTHGLTSQSHPPSQACASG